MGRTWFSIFITFAAAACASSTSPWNSRLKVDDFEDDEFVFRPLTRERQSDTARIRQFYTDSDADPDVLEFNGGAPSAADSIHESLQQRAGKRRQIHRNHHHGYRHYAINVNHKHGGPSGVGPGHEQHWKVDCFGKDYGHEHGFITAIWDDGNDFEDLDSIRCSVALDSTEGIILDVTDQKRIDLSPEANNNYTANCPRGYLLTGLWDSDSDFRHVTYGKCTRVMERHGGGSRLDNDHCNNFYTRYKDGGPWPHPEHETNWGARCRGGWGAIGLCRTVRRIDHLRCCRIINAFDKARGEDADETTPLAGRRSPKL